eukprot:CAMPEP_0181440656 /NCGR_PEP_ID=MMETSP1110-20121109/23086_1 /TAXON_ID=174948 /ORGANISM="Symbiodinium sp., Strain CCMP421" /LENGTH=34 /DNA_ID= /DNA_START= /DNA_END= /DNA_ORIENTATION=
MAPGHTFLVKQLVGSQEVFHVLVWQRVDGHQGTE